jgi:hypothetical protein
MHEVHTPSPAVSHNSVGAGWRWLDVNNVDDGGQIVVRSGDERADPGQHHYLSW